MVVLTSALAVFLGLRRGQTFPRTVLMCVAGFFLGIVIAAIIARASPIDAGASFVFVVLAIVVEMLNAEWYDFFTVHTIAPMIVVVLALTQWQPGRRWSVIAVGSVAVTALQFFSYYWLEANVSHYHRFQIADAMNALTFNFFWICLNCFILWGLLYLLLRVWHLFLRSRSTPDKRTPS